MLEHPHRRTVVNEPRFSNNSMTDWNSRSLGLAPLLPQAGLAQDPGPKPQDLLSAQDCYGAGVVVGFPGERLFEALEGVGTSGVPRVPMLAVLREAV